jgi:hypothetical protein
MKIDEQKAFDKLSDDKSKIEDDYKKLIAQNKKLQNDLILDQQKIHRLILESLDNFATIGKLKSCSTWATIFSFTISLIMGYLVIKNLVPQVNWNQILGVVIGVWWFSLFSYYGFWRAQFWD